MTAIDEKAMEAAKEAWNDSHPEMQHELDVPLSAAILAYEAHIRSALAPVDTPMPTEEEVEAKEVPRSSTPPAVPTKSQADLLARAERDGNALLKFGIRQMAGGAIRRSADRLVGAGLLDKSYAITPAGAALLAASRVRRETK